ncbi:MAG: TraB/GumN family protein [Sphingobium sp.]|nr:TraB/GumN family protein [Sphingobium sp.]
MAPVPACFAKLTRALRPMLSGVVALALAACGGASKPAQEDARPALWLARKGDQQAWLLGTVHLIPADARWDGGKVADAINGSRRLIVEAAEIDDPQAVTAVFARLAQTPGTPSLSPYLTKAQGQKLHDLLPALPPGVEPWAAALMLNAELDKHLPVATGEGVDQSLIRRFRDKGLPVVGLESVEEQLSAFDGLPLRVQGKLLASTIDEAGQSPDAFIGMYRDWAKGDVARLGRSLNAELSGVAELRAPLLTRRNMAWDHRIDALIAPPGTELIAVGAAHLIGPDSLIALMEKRGWRVERVQ